MPRRALRAAVCVADTDTDGATDSDTDADSEADVLLGSLHVILTLNLPGCHKCDY